MRQAQLPSTTTSTPRAEAAGEASVSPWSSIVFPFLAFCLLAVSTVWVSLDPRRIDQGRWIGVSGLALVVLIASLIAQSLRLKSYQDGQTRRHLQALEKLTEISASISARIDSPSLALDQLAAAGVELLEMERAGIAMFDAEKRTLTVVAFVGDMDLAPPRVYQIDDLPLCRTAMETQDEVFIEDSFHHRSPANVDMLRRVRAGSMALLPLHVGGRALGLLFISHSQPQVFTDRRRRVARLLGNQAAVILANSELYQRMLEAMQNQQRLFKQRESIFAVNAAVYQASSFEESLQIIVRLAPGVLEVDICMVTLNGDEDRSVVAAITGPDGADFVGKMFMRKGTNSDVVRATRRMLVVEDARHHPGTHPAFRDILDAGSVAYLPLLGTGAEVMGMLVLIRHVAGPFKPEQLSLAEMFTARAAAALENARLLEQTRHDAQTKAMLLRELNHRVKNNLSSIMTLLSLEKPDLSAAARQWLDRAIDRIRTMAQTHDLFARGIDRVSLDELIAQVIPSLSVVKPPGVAIRLELTEAPILLRTDRAVSLAMVLHELCSNALVHGTGCSGVVVVRATMHEGVQPAGPGAAAPDGRVVLDVIDGGRGAARQTPVHQLAFVGATTAEGRPAIGGPTAMEAGSGSCGGPVGSGGFGLILVEGLVTRELGGTFLRTGMEGGGSLARVEFPVTPAETSPAREK